MPAIKTLENHYLLERLGTVDLARLLRLRKQYGEQVFAVELASILNSEPMQEWRARALQAASSKSRMDYPRLLLANVVKSIKSIVTSKKPSSPNWTKAQLAALQEAMKPQVTMLATYKLMEELRHELGDAQLDIWEKLFATGVKQEVWESLRVELSKLGGESLDSRMKRLIREAAEGLAGIYTEDYETVLRMGGV
jgi:hypothetical protein